MPRPGDVLSSILSAGQTARPVANPGQVLGRVLGGAPAPAPKLPAGAPSPASVLNKVLSGPSLDMSGEWVQTPTGRVRRDIYEQEQGYAKQSAAQVKPGIDMSGPAAPAQIKRTPTYWEKSKAQVERGDILGPLEPMLNNRPAQVVLSPLTVTGQSTNAMLQAALEPIIDPDAAPTMEERFRQNYVDPQVSKAFIENADGSFTSQAGAALGASLMDMADPEIVLGLPAVANAVSRGARRKAIAAGMKDLAPSVPQGEAAQMARAAQEQAVGRTMDQARQLGLEPSAKQVTDAGYQARVLDLTEARQGLEQQRRPLQEVAATERQLAPVGRPKPGPKSAYQLRKEMRQAPNTPGEVLQNVLKGQDEAPVTVRAAVSEAPATSEVLKRVLNDDQAPTGRQVEPAPEPEALRLAMRESIQQELRKESSLPEPAARATDQPPHARAAEEPIADLPDDGFFDGAEGFDPQFYNRGDSRPRTIAELRAESEARLAAREARNPTKTYPVPDREISLDEVVQARDVVKEWSKRPEVRGKIRQTSQGMDHPDLMALMPPEVRDAKLTTELWQGQRRVAPDAHQAAVRAAEVEVGRAAPPEVNPRGRLKPGGLAQDAQGPYVDMGTRRYRMSEADAERYQRLPEAGIDPASWLKTRRYEPAPGAPKPRPELLAPKEPPLAPDAPSQELATRGEGVAHIRGVPETKPRPRAGLDFEADQPRFAPDEPPTGGAAAAPKDEIAAAQSRVSALREDLARKKAAGADVTEAEADLEVAKHDFHRRVTEDEERVPVSRADAERAGQAEEDLEVSKNEFNRRVLNDETDRPGPRVGQDAELRYEVDGHQVHLSGDVKPLPLPALVRFVKELTGDVPSISEGLVALGKRMGGTVRGKVQGARSILLNPAILKDPILAARVAAHEIGHLDNWVQGARTGIADSVSQVRKRMRTWFKSMDEDVRKELWELSKEWRPIDEATAKPSELRYRQDPEELFADAISRMFHDPDELAKRAPKFWAGFTKMLDAAPTLKQAIADVHAWRSGTLEDLTKGIRQEIASDLLKGEDLFKALKTEAKAREDSLLYRMSQNWWAQLRSEWSDTGAALKGWANKLDRMGLEVPENIDPRLTYDVWQMPDGATKQVLDGFNSDVLQPIRAAGLDEHQVGEWMEWQAIADGHRAGMANPKGKTPVEAREALRQIESSLSPEQLAAMKTAGEKTRAMFWDALQEGRDMIGSEALDRLKAHKDSLAPMLELQKLHEGAKLEDILSSIEAGSFRDAQNPLITMVQQTIAIRNWARRNKARTATLDFVRAFEPDEIATKAGGGKEAFSVYKDGVKHTSYVDPYLESLFQVGGTREVNTLVKLLSGQVGPAPLRAVMKLGNQGAMNLWLRWNPAFYAAQGVMDMFRSSRNLAAVGLYNAWAPGNSLRVLKSWGEALKPALAYARNKPDDLISKMIDEHAILPPDLSLTNQLAGDQLGSMAQLDTILAEAGVNTAKAMEQGGRLKRVATKMGDFWTAMGRLSESVPKIAAYQELSKSAKFTPEMRAHIVRTKIGQPAGYVKGTQMRSSGRVLAFANTILQGLRSDVHLSATPKTRSGFLMAALKHATTPKLLMVAAGAGLMGKELAEMYAAIPERDKRNGTPIPMFWDAWEEGGEHGRKVRYFMVPSDPTDKLFGSFIYELLTAPTSDRETQDYVKDLQETLADFQPGFTPAIEGGIAFADAMTKDEPKDSGGRPIISKDESQAGLLPRLNGYVRWQLGQGGVIGQNVQAAVYRENLRQQSDWTPANIPTLGRFFKVSDAGFAERQRRGETLEQRGQARNRISYGPTVRELRQQYSRLQKLGVDKRTPQQDAAYQDLKDWYSLYEGQQQEVEMANPEQAKALRDSLERQSQSYMTNFQRQTKRKW